MNEIVLMEVDELSRNIDRLLATSPDLINRDALHKWTIDHVGELFALMERDHTGY